MQQARERSPYLRVCGISHGGMGYVELVVKRGGRFERRYARKRLHVQYRSDPGFREMFMDEARLAGLMNHPNVVGVVDVGEDEEGPYLIMDFVDGVPLSKVLVEAASRGEPLPIQVGVRIALEAARGLEAAHELGAADGTPLHLVHRDVSPQNILVGFDGSVRVTDFGIAKAFGNASETTTGVLKGTLGYLSPEQLRFEEPDHRADLFALGVILYELLAGQRLYANRQGYDSARRTLSEAPPDIGDVRPEVPPPLVELLFELLAKDRAKRLPSAHELVNRLGGLLADLAAAESPLEIADYMKTHFDDARQTQQAELARLVEERRHERTSMIRGRHMVLGVVTTVVAVAATAVWWRLTPNKVVPGSRRTAWAGGWHSCAEEDGALYCWGKNNEGQLGIGSLRDVSTRQPVRGLPAFTSVALGFFHTCVCAADGRAFCWGRNVEAQVGRAPTPHEKTPIPVPGIVDCAEIAAGALHSCVLHKDRTVSCWGKNTAGQTGQPVETLGSGPDQVPWLNVPGSRRSAARPITRPRPVPGVSDVVQIDADDDYTCALRADGTVLCWGANDAGQLGDGARDARATPAAVSGLNDVAEVATGRTFACARRRSGQVACWGSNLRGSLGDGTTTSRPAPAPVPGLGDVVQISAGYQHACALTRSGLAWCWGANDNGQLGSRAGHPSLRPVQVSEIARFASISAGEVHNCGRHDSGVACWGDSETGQVGDGSFVPRFAPVSVAGFR